MGGNGTNEREKEEEQKNETNKRILVYMESSPRDEDRLQDGIRYYDVPWGILRDVSSVVVTARVWVDASGRALGSGDGWGSESSGPVENWLVASYRPQRRSRHDYSRTQTDDSASPHKLI